LSDGQSDRNLTTVGPVEYAVDLLSDGHALAWRPDDVGTQMDGNLREYDPQGQVVWNRAAKINPPWTFHVGDALVSGILGGQAGMAAYIYDLRRNVRFVVPLPTTVFAAAKG